jgi:hypothetical protein
MKAAIQGSGSTHRPAEPAAKVSNAQIADFAKFGQRPKDVIRLQDFLQLSLNSSATSTGCCQPKARLLTLKAIEGFDQQMDFG